MGQLRTIRYLVVDDIQKDVPDTAPEVDVEVRTADDVLQVLTRAVQIPSGAEIFLQTLRADGTPRWQELRLISSLPEEPTVLLVKVVKSGEVTQSPCSIVMTR
jgi:hypothetical protein